MCICADKSFKLGDLACFLKERDTKLEPVPPGQRSQNAIESSHKIIHQTFLKLKYAHPDSDNDKLPVRAFFISNDLYGNDMLSAFELDKTLRSRLTKMMFMPVSVRSKMRI